MRRYDYYNLVSGGKFFPDPLQFVASHKLPAWGFASVYAVSEDTKRAVEEENNATGFKGVVWSERLWLDIEQEEALVEARRILKEMNYDHVVFDTGNRGGHIGVLRNSRPSHLLPARDKAWATEHFKCDPSLYTHLHLFRLSGTVHEKTGRRKTQIDAVAGTALELPKLVQSQIAIRDTNPVSKGCSLFDNHYVLANSSPRQGTGGRHEQLVRLLYGLKNSQVSPSNALFWACEVNKTFEEPKHEEEIERLVRSIYGT